MHFFLLFILLPIPFHWFAAQSMETCKDAFEETPVRREQVAIS
jgi:hypothetical protein